MAGQTTAFTKRIEKQMYAASADQDYERAARLRDDIGALNRAMEKQQVVLGDGTDADVVALSEDPLEVAVQIFYVRGGRIRGQRGWVADKADDSDTAGLVERFLLQLYDGEIGDSIPREVLVPALPEDTPALEQWLSDLRGARVSIKVPQRGDKKALQETVARNALQSLGLHKTKRASDLTTRNRALEEIQVALGLPTAPLRVECYDISNLQGTEVVASMVVFEDGLARKSEYRRFVIKGVDGPERRRLDARGDHPAVPPAARRAGGDRRVRRRPRRRAGSDADRPGHRAAQEVRLRPGAGRRRRRPARRSRPPSGPSTSSASTTSRSCGLAKRLEEVWLPSQEDPVILPRTSEGLYLLQRIRDEAHRFAITHHRSRRSKSMVESLLDDVPGLGEVRRKSLLKRFGSLKKLRAATVEEIAEVPGIGARTADAIVAALAEQKGRTAVSVNTATGEIEES